MADRRPASLFTDLPTHESKFSLKPATIDALIAALGSESPLVATAARRKLQQTGPAVVPSLLNTMQDPEKPRQEAADVLSRIIGDVPPSEIASAPPAELAAPPREPVPTVAKAAPERADSQWLARKIDAEKAKVVRVYYGTNREILDHPRSPLRTGIVSGLHCDRFSDRIRTDSSLAHQRDAATARVPEAVHCHPSRRRNRVWRRAHSCRDQGDGSATARRAVRPPPGIGYGFVLPIL